MLSSMMATKPGAAIEIEIAGRTAKAERRALLTGIAEQRIALTQIARSPIVRVTLTLLGPRRAPKEITQAVSALKHELPGALGIERARVEWRYDLLDAEKYSARIRVEARELVIISQEVSRA